MTFGRPTGWSGRWLFKTFAACVGIAALSASVCLSASAYWIPRSYDLDDIYLVRANDASGKTVQITVADISRWREALDDVEVAWIYAPTAERDTFYEIDGRSLVGRSMSVSANFLDVLRIQLDEGRNEPGYLLGHDFWAARFGRNRVIGSLVRVEGHAAGPVARVSGVVPAGCCAPFRRDLIKVEAEPANHRLPVRPIVRDGGRNGIDTLRARLTAIDVTAQYHSLSFEPLRRAVLGSTATVIVALLLIGVIAFCVSLLTVTQIDSAEDLSRPAEWALRAMLGASDARLARDVLSRMAACIVPAAIAALPVARGAINLAVNTSGPSELSLPDVPIGLILSAVSVAAVVAFVFIALVELPLVRRLARNAGVHRGTHVLSWQRRLSIGMAACQIALGVTTAYGAVLLGRTMMAVSAFDADVRTSQVYAADITQPVLKDLHEVKHYAHPRFSRVVEGLLASLEGHPDVVAAGLVMPSPFTRSPGLRTYQRLGGPALAAPRDIKPITPEDATGTAIPLIVTPASLQILGLRVTNGRSWSGEERFRPRALLDDRARARPPAPVLVSESLAQRAWGDQSAVGEYLRLDGAPYGSLQVLGTVQNAHLFGPDSSLDVVYMPFEWNPSAFATVLAIGRTPAGAVAAIRGAVDATKGYAALGRIEPLTDLRARGRQLQQQLLIVFALAAVACVLIAGGSVYAAVAFQLESRRHETAVRIALGADRRKLTRMVTGFAAPMIVTGFAIGLGLSRFVSSELSGALYRAGESQVYLLAVTMTLFGVIAGLATIPHVVSAIRTDPAHLLRLGRVQ